MEKESLDFLTSSLNRRMNKETMKYLASKQMFCKVTGAILDYRTMIQIEIHDRTGKLIDICAVSPNAEDRLNNVPPAVEAAFPGGTVTFTTLNKKLTNPLLIKI